MFNLRAMIPSNTSVIKPITKKATIHWLEEVYGKMADARMATPSTSRDKMSACGMRFFTRLKIRIQSKLVFQLLHHRILLHQVFEFFPIGVKDFLIVSHSFYFTAQLQRVVA